jgi:hypothetical protein
MLPAGKPPGGTADGGMKMLHGGGDGPVGSCWYTAEHAMLLPPWDILAAAEAPPVVLWLRAVAASAAEAAVMVKLLLLG